MSALRLPEPRALHGYLLVVILAGGGAIAAVLAGGDALRIDAQLAALAAFVVLGELLPIKVPRHEGTVTTSTTFAFALLLSHGAAEAMLTLAIASALADLVHRRGAWGTAFNAAQYALAVGASALVLGSLAGLPHASAPHFAPGDLPVIVLAAVAFFVVNNALAGAASALLERLPVVRGFLDDGGFHASTAGMMLALAPIVVITADFAVAVTPLLAVPLIAVYTTARAVERSHHLARHDALTGLPNRTMLRERLADAVAAADGGGRTAVLLLDLDGFKSVNDTLGHAHGDLLLRAVGRRIVAAAREGDTVARIGGDEFGVVLPEIAGADEAIAIADAIAGTLRAPFALDGVPLEVGATIGIACFPEHGDGADALIQRAHVAMQQATERHARRHLYSPADDRSSIEQLELAARLRRAIADGELVVHYQPKLDLRSGEVTGAEALVRWQHPERGLIPPDRFIPIAEQTGLVIELTDAVLATAVEQQRRWRARGIALSVAVNLSARALADRGLPDRVAALLGADAKGVLELELTESTVMADPDNALAVLERLAAMGVRLAIDDFGTGYSSLAYLRRLPVSDLKIDRSFVANVAAAGSDAAIVRATVELAHSLGLEVVAEGVEDDAALTALRRLGCERAQGYHIARPLPAERFEAWLVSRAASRSRAASLA